MSSSIPSPEDARRILQALQQKVRDLRQSVEDHDAEIERLKEENQKLRERLAEVEARADPLPGQKAYEQKDRPEKVLELQVALTRKAMSNGGSAAYDYQQVLSLFDEYPAPSTAYTLMRQAAGHDGDDDVSRKDGFEYTTIGGQQHLTVTAADITDDRVICAAKNEDGGRAA